MSGEDLRGKLALVTGATGGIGKATCKKLAELGINIAVHYNSAVDAADELVKDLKATGVEASAFQADISNYDSVWLPIGGTSCSSMHRLTDSSRRSATSTKQ